jgi:hypothetical protein
MGRGRVYEALLYSLTMVEMLDRGCHHILTIVRNEVECRATLSGHGSIDRE